MGRASKQKGARAELEVAALLQAWWRQLPGHDACRFVRTPLSGGWHGSDVRAGFQSSGDLMTTSKRFPWTVEVKRREGWSRRNLEAARPSPVWGWWAQACEQAKELGKEPMLWLRRSRDPWLILLHAESVREKCMEFEWEMQWDAYDLLKRGVSEPAQLKGVTAEELLGWDPAFFAV